MLYLMSIYCVFVYFSGCGDRIRTALCCLDREQTPSFVIQVVASDGGGLKGKSNRIIVNSHSTLSSTEGKNRGTHGRRGEQRSE